MEYYPVFLTLSGRRCVVVGGGAVAHEKIEGLLRAEAAVTVIAEKLTPKLQELVATGAVDHIPRNICQATWQQHSSSSVLPETQRPRGGSLRRRACGTFR